MRESANRVTEMEKGREREKERGRERNLFCRTTTLGLFTPSRNEEKMRQRKKEKTRESKKFLRGPFSDVL